MEEMHLSVEQEEFYQWLEQLDMDRPLAELVETPEVLEPPHFEPEELQRLEMLGREYAQELLDRDAIPALPPMDLDARFLEPEPTIDLDHDIDR